MNLKNNYQLSIFNYQLFTEFNISAPGLSKMRLVLDENGNWKKEFLVKDQVGTTKALIENKDGMPQVTNRYIYGPYGEPLHYDNEKERQGFISKEKDLESGLADHGVRKYDYISGRFTSTDPLWEKYMGLTPYQYSANNPVSLLDENGKEYNIFAGSFSGKTQKQYEVISKVCLFQVGIAGAATGILLSGGALASPTISTASILCESFSLMSSTTSLITTGISAYGDISGKTNVTNKVQHSFFSLLAGSVIDASIDNKNQEVTNVIDFIYFPIEIVSSFKYKSFMKFSIISSDLNSMKNSANNQNKNDDDPTLQKMDNKYNPVVTPSNSKISPPY